MLKVDLMDFLNNTTGVKLHMGLPWVIAFNIGDAQVNYLIYELQGMYGLDAVVDKPGIIESLHRAYLPMYDTGSIQRKRPWKSKRERQIECKDNYFKRKQLDMRKNGVKPEEVVEVRCQFSETYNDFEIFLMGLTKLFCVRGKSVSDINIIDDPELMDLIMQLG